MTVPKDKAKMYPVKIQIVVPVIDAFGEQEDLALEIEGFLTDYKETKHSALPDEKAILSGYKPELMKLIIKSQIREVTIMARVTNIYM